MQRRLNLTGLKFKNLTVLYPSGKTRGGRITWLCECVCGKTKTYSVNHLTRKKDPVRSCGCLKHPKGEKSKHWKGVGDISGNWWYNHVLRERTQTKRPKVPVTVTIQEAWELYTSQEGKCALTGVPIDIGYGPNKSASIDRIDSSKGYELGNIQWVDKDVNFMKRTYSMEYFIRLCKLVADKHK